MIARNGAKTMRRALDPFRGKVDEVAIVLGGKSADNTAAIARRYGKVLEFDGPLGDDGRLLDFGAARQQSFDALSTDYAFVVDTDDEWTGVENFEQILQRAGDRGAAFVEFPYSLESVVFKQPRLFKRRAGRWVYPVHEYFQITESPIRIAQTDLMSVSQKRANGANVKALARNVELAEHWLQEHGDDRRALMMLIQDSHDKPEKVLELCERHATLPPGSPGDEFYVQYMKALALLNLERYEETLQTVYRALGYQGFGYGWTLAAEAALQLGRHNPAYHELAVMYADKALACGRPDATYPYNPKHVTSVPLHTKARALALLGRLNEAGQALDLAIAMEPDNRDMRALAGQLAAMKTQ